DEDADQDVDPLIKLAKAAATAAAASAVPTGGSHEAEIPPSSSVPTDEFAGGSDVPAGATTDPSNKGKSPLMEEDPPFRERTFRQREEDRLGEEAVRKIYEEEQAELEREREEIQKKRQHDVLNSAKYYTDFDWTDIMGQVHANQELTANLLGPDVNEDYFAERMHVKSFSDDQLKTEFDKIRTAAAELQSQTIRMSLKRPGADLEQARSKKSKPTESPKSSVPDASQQPSAEVPPAATQQPSEFSSQPTIPYAEPRYKFLYGYQEKVSWARRSPLTELDLTADDRSFIRLLSDDSDDSNDDDDHPIFWSAFATWEVGDLQVVFESHEGGTGAGVWADQQQWVIRSWRLFPFSGVHVLETISGKILYMLADTPYPLLAQL
ncbi:hypothetical protein Tco_1552956, partial [Tanacetum coccineum]